jgi:polar amino acid transport system substrate-binding protein
MKPLGLFLVLTMLCLSAPVRAETIVLASDYWCPYICDPIKTGRAGISVDIARAIFEEAGHTVSFMPVNWKRAIDETRSGGFDAIVDATRDDAPDFVYPVEPINDQTTCFFTSRSSHWTYKNIESLKNVSLGVIAGYHYSSELDDYVLRNRNTGRVAIMHGDNALSRNVRRVRLGMIDVLAEDPLVLGWLLRTQGEGAALRMAGCLDERTPLFIAFSPANPHSQEYARIFSEGVRRLRQSGGLEHIRKQYGVD